MKISAPLKAIMLAAVFMTMAASTMAQNNPYQIDDGIYQRYLEANKIRREKRVLPIVEEMYNDAVKLGDKKAQCVVLSLPVSHYFQAYDEENLEKVCDRLRALAKKYNLLQYYYYAWRQQIVLYVANGKVSKALKYANEVRAEAKLHNHYYGNYVASSIIAEIYKDYGEDMLAIEAYKEGIDQVLKHEPNQAIGIGCAYLARLLRNHGQPAEAEKYIEYGFISNIKTRNQSILLAERALLRHDANNMEAFMKDAELCLQTAEIEKEHTDPIKEVEVFLELARGSEEKALALTEKFSKKSTRYEMKGKVYEKLGDWKNAVEQYRLYMEEKKKENVANSSLYIKELSAQYNTMRLEKENSQLQAQAMKAQALAAQKEIDNQQQQMTILKQNAENEHLLSVNSMLRVDTLERGNKARQVMIAQQRAELAEQDAMLLASRYFSVIVVLILVLLAMMVIYLIFSRRRRINFLKQLNAKNTELEDTNKQLSEAIEKAEHAEKMKTAFIQSMTHEIRTPLNAIVGFTNLVSDGSVQLSEEESQEFSQLIGKNSNLLVKLINDILLVSDQQSGNSELNYERCFINDLCHTAINEARPHLHQGVEIAYETDIDNTFMMEIDRERLRQVLGNILLNACKFTKQGSIRLTTSLKAKPDYITFAVEDTGIGIPADKHEIIFERFQKVNDFEQGTGLGLYICRNVANMMSAQLYVDPEYTRGARFVFELPLRNKYELQSDGI